MTLASFLTAPVLVGLREPLPKFIMAPHQLVQKRQGMQQNVGELATNVLFANYNIHLVSNYIDSQSNECKSPVFLWLFNPSLFWGVFPLCSCRVFEEEATQEGSL